MRSPLATDLATTALVLVALPALFPLADGLARLALEGAGAEPWVVAVAGFALLRGAAAVLCGVARGFAWAFVVTMASSRSSPPPVS